MVFVFWIFGEEGRGFSSAGAASSSKQQAASSITIPIPCMNDEELGGEREVTPNVRRGGLYTLLMNLRQLPSRFLFFSFLSVQC